MELIEPFFQESGAGPGVVCFHANASSSAQWRGLSQLLAPQFHVLAPDSYGAGKSPAWPSDRIVTLSDEVALAEPGLARAGRPLTLVGHSYGGAVALIAALLNPDRVRAIAVYEPTLFSLLDAEMPPKGSATWARLRIQTSSMRSLHDSSSGTEPSLRPRLPLDTSFGRFLQAVASWATGFVKASLRILFRLPECSSVRSLPLVASSVCPDLPPSCFCSAACCSFSPSAIISCRAPPKPGSPGSPWRCIWITTG